MIVISTLTVELGIIFYFGFFFHEQKSCNFFCCLKIAKSSIIYINTKLYVCRTMVGIIFDKKCFLNEIYINYVT